MRRGATPAPRPTAPAPTASKVSRPSSPPPAKSGGFGSRLKSLAQATREKLESLPRTDQSLGTPQQPGIGSSNPYEEEARNSRSQVGPALADLKPSSKPRYTPEPNYSQLAESKTSSKPKTSIAEPSSKPKTKSKSSTASQLAEVASQVAKKAGVSDEMKKRIITEATPAADEIAKTLEGNKVNAPADLTHMKVAPRTLVASLEKYIPLEAEQLIGTVDEIDLDGADLEPLTVPVRNIASAAIKRTQKVVSKKRLDPAKIPAADAVALDPQAGTTPPVANPSPAPNSGQLQPLGMSFFERFALSTMVASENHLASVPLTTDEPATKTVSTVANGDVEMIDQPVILDDPEAVKFQANDIPPSHVSPGLDEMVISSTSQTDFDLNDSEMAFIGNVQVKSPRFNLRSDKFIVHLKKDNSGMAYGEAIGNVVIEMRENGRPTGYSGLASNAVYHPQDGKIILSGWPKIRQQFKEHVAVNRDTKMVLYTDGRVKTIGRNRTVIRK
ncbi:MAG: lipopolysaccharide transport protein LptA [Verrucomicrobiales bacterium]|jgi:lipopolysaccharide transport protein LptA